MYNVLLEKIIFFYLFWRFFLDSLSLLILILKLRWIMFYLDNEYSDMFIYLFKEMDVKSEISYFY